MPAWGLQAGHNNRRTDGGYALPSAIAINDLVLKKNAACISAGEGLTLTFELTKDLQEAQTSHDVFCRDLSANGIGE
ncbi:hypothetical protein NDU88_002095 [Pleurodeles waltl]|uniref:Uncharacterized protein n=1 Tax=Pleurodeles waltl TaxID=8319 RepID=A0AAV7NGN6_PLEWA|nr:hypothetical protein NDU88_002095 [Pleurodeles waltl]